MGTFSWHDWGRLLALTSGAYVAWAALWGCFYCKYFWDFVGGELGPKGIIPPPSAAFFEKVIVDAPILQILTILNGVFTLAFEWPLPFLLGTTLHRSHVFRLLFYTWSSVLAMLIYQTIDGGVFYFIALLAYTRSLSKGEKIAKPWETSSEVKT